MELGTHTNATSNEAEDYFFSRPMAFAPLWWGDVLIEHPKRQNRVEYYAK